MEKNIEMIVQFRDDDRLGLEHAAQLLRTATKPTGVTYSRMEPYLSWEDPDPEIRQRARAFRVSSPNSTENYMVMNYLVRPDRYEVQCAEEVKRYNE